MMQWDEGEEGETRTISADAWICFNGAEILEAKNEFESCCVMEGWRVFWWFFGKSLKL